MGWRDWWYGGEVIAASFLEVTAIMTHDFKATAWELFKVLIARLRVTS